MKTTNDDKDIRHYFKEIKSLFPVFGKREKRFLLDFKIDVENYRATASSYDYANIVSQFGEPNIIISNYLRDAEPRYLLRQMRLGKYVRRGVAIVVILALIASSAVVALKSKSYLEAKASYIAREIVIIDEE
jgi:hypothetical protein